MTGNITELCTGCQTCVQVCPKKCIAMHEDDEGFLVPIVNNQICIDCGKCIRKCPQNDDSGKFMPIKVLAARDKNDNELKKSASGGAFAAIARYFILKGGTVYGVSYLDNLEVGHIPVNKLEELYRLQSSKYVQSNTFNTFAEVKSLLIEGKDVLYSGTPCQIAGLKKYLGKEYEQLFTIDLICHGVPSPKLFAKYVKWLGCKIGNEVLSYNFRDKSVGWGLNTKIETKSKMKVIDASIDPYYHHFLEGNIYRECCYRCKYSESHRIADITIGDYWGIEKEHPRFNSLKGVSAMLLNTEKALAIQPVLSELFYLKESTFDKVARYNHNLKYPTLRKPIRDRIYLNIHEKSDNDFITENLAFSSSKIAKIKAMLPPKLKYFIKQIKYGF